MGAFRTVAARADDYEAVYREVYADLVRWTTVVARDPEAGADVAAEAFVRLLATRARVADPVAYLHRVALNLVRDRWRHQQIIRRTAPLVATDDTVPGPNLDLRDAVERLPARLRDPVVLHYFGGMPVAQVAAVLQRPVGTVTRRLTDARAELRVALTS